MAEGGERKKRRWRSVAEKLRIVEESLVPGASVALVARAHEVNANQVFLWRRLHQKGLLQARRQKSTLVPVRVKEDLVPAHTRSVRRKADLGMVPAACGSIHIELASARLRIEGAVDRVTLLAVLECLQG
jgi:transposase